jgi:hypothetical protein
VSDFTIGFLLGVICSAAPCILYGAVLADALSSARRRRRRRNIELLGSDAVESWVDAAGLEWPRRQTNGTPFPEEDEVA